MKIFILGATGLIGQKLVIDLLRKNYEVCLLSRNTKKAKDLFPDIVEIIEGNPSKEGIWQEKIKEAEIIINLSGESVSQRWNANVKNKIYDSRINSTKNIVSALSDEKKKTKLLINASAVGFYGFQEDDRELNENETQGNDFLSYLCKDWENQALKAKRFGVRVVTPRIGIVLAEKGGALEKIILPFNAYLGGYTGNGKQWVPWIHLDDIVGLFNFCIENKNINGSINFTAPKPENMKEMTKIIGKILKRPSFFPAPTVSLKAMFGEFSDYLVTGQRVIPEKALKNNYKFEFENIEKALLNLLE